MPDIEVRNQVMPLPGRGAGYRTIMTLGTTGAGKTTVVRQLLGTNPRTERFPSTSAAKTTVSDTEIILQDIPSFRACVTFMSLEDVSAALRECVSAAALAIVREHSERRVLRSLLDHPTQRIRFSYILGQPPAADNEMDDESDEDEVTPLIPSVASVDLATTQAVLRACIETLRDVVGDHIEDARSEASADENDVLVEESLDQSLGIDYRVDEIVDELLEQIRLRFEALNVGELETDIDDWPTFWTWSTPDRTQFITTIARFTSNYSPLFGTLLTPLVSGIRAAGPFRPTWMKTVPRLVLVDGEGLGHTPKSASAISTTITERFPEVDAILLVDNASQPMQAAPTAALKAIVTTGNANKLVLCFSHFDMVKGDNLPTVEDREDHVRASVENVIGQIGLEAGQFASRALTQRAQNATFFVSRIHKELDPLKGPSARTIRALEAMIRAIEAIELPASTEAARPVFDRANLVVAVRESAAHFQTRWNGLLGLTGQADPDHPKEHWTRVKALSRRLAGAGYEYGDLKPIADLDEALRDNIFLLLQKPVEWDGPEPNDDEKQEIFQILAGAIYNEIAQLTKRRIAEDHTDAWRDAYDLAGPGSTKVRAQLISGDIYQQAAPVPDVTPSPDGNQFLHDVQTAVEKVAGVHYIRLI